MTWVNDLMQAAGLEKCNPTPVQPLSVLDRKEIRHVFLKRRTAAYEALVICKKLYPWRVNGYLPKPVND